MACLFVIGEDRFWLYLPLNMESLYFTMSFLVTLELRTI